MLHDFSRRRFIATAIGGLSALFVPRLAFACKPTTLMLNSRYTGKCVLDGARTVTLSVTWRDATRGEGVLTFDPNITDGMFSTCIAINEIPVVITQSHDTQSVRNAKRYYELKERGSDGKVKSGKRSWQLEQALTTDPKFALISIDKDGKETATVDLFK